MSYAFWSLIAIAALHGISCVEFILTRRAALAFVMAGFVISDLAFAWMAQK